MNRLLSADFTKLKKNKFFWICMIGMFLFGIFMAVIQCEVVCENGVLRMPDPSGLLVRAEAKRYTALETDWVLRFLDAYDLELQEWVEDLQAGRLRGPSSWDGYAAAVTADALLRAQKSGQIEPVSLETCPDIYRSL